MKLWLKLHESGLILESFVLEDEQTMPEPFMVQEDSFYQQWLQWNQVIESDGVEVANDEVGNPFDIYHEMNTEDMDKLDDCVLATSVRNEIARQQQLGVGKQIVNP